MSYELKEIIKRDCYRKGEFKLSSGKISEHYINCKPVTLSGKTLREIAISIMGHLKTDYVAGLTLGADPLVSAVTVLSEGYGLIVRKEPKGHGTGAWLEGPLPRIGTTITVLEDVVTTGSSCIKAVDKLREAGYVVHTVITVIDRQEGGEKALNNVGLKLISLVKLDELLR